MLVNSIVNITIFFKNTISERYYCKNCMNHCCWRIMLISATTGTLTQKWLRIKFPNPLSPVVLLQLPPPLGLAGDERLRAPPGGGRARGADEARRPGWGLGARRLDVYQAPAEEG